MTSNAPDGTVRRGRRPLRVAALGLSSAAVIGLMVGLNSSPSTVASAATPAPAPTAAPWAGYADLIEQVMPSVVAITVTHSGANQPVADQPQQRQFRFNGEDGARTAR